jgi:hypothetical protein
MSAAKTADIDLKPQLFVSPSFQHSLLWVFHWNELLRGRVSRPLSMTSPISNAAASAQLELQRAQAQRVGDNRYRAE